jgi:hypothetical protein
MAATFVAVAVTAYRATDGASRQERLRDADRDPDRDPDRTSRDERVPDTDAPAD